MKVSLSPSNKHANGSERKTNAQRPVGHRDKKNVPNLIIQAPAKMS